MKDETKLQKWSLGKFKKEFWKVFALYIKQRDKYKCFTCGAKVSGANAHAGHFIPKSAGGLALYFDERNVHCQCAKCNLFLQGNQYEYGERLGKEVVAELQELYKENWKWDKQDYLERINDYKEKLHHETNKKGNRRRNE